LLWSGQTLSRLGDSLYRIALSWWVLEKTGSAAVMGTVLIFSFTPMLIFLLIGGVAVDRFPRMRIMFLSDVLRGIAVLLVAWLAYTQAMQIWHIYAASIFFGLVDAFFQPAYIAAVPEIAPANLLPSANSLTSLSQQVASVAGPAIGAAIVALGGTSLAFALNGLSFFLSAGLLLPILELLPTPGSAGAEKERGVLGELRLGLAQVLASPWLWITIAIASLSNVTMSGPVSVSLPFLVKGRLQSGVNLLGLLYSLSSVGAVLAAIVLGRLERIHRRGLLAYCAWVLSGVCVLAFGLRVPVPIVAAAALLNGFGIGVFGLIWTNTLQELVPARLLGRVASIDALGSYALLPVGFGIAGWATDRLGAPLVFILGGTVTVLLSLLGLTHPGIRRLD
jgi:DHA3 family tetracycline resistance protein-like MFS transporter